MRNYWKWYEKPAHRGCFGDLKPVYGCVNMIIAAYLIIFKSDISAPKMLEINNSKGTLQGCNQKFSDCLWFSKFWISQEKSTNFYITWNLIFSSNFPELNFSANIFFGLYFSISIWWQFLFSSHQIVCKSNSITELFNINHILKNQ